MGFFGLFGGKKQGVHVDMSPVPGKVMANPVKVEAANKEAAAATAASAETAQNIAQSEFPGLYEGMVLSVVDSDDIIMFHGKLSSFTPDGMTLKRPQGVKAFPVVEVSKPVKIRGYDRNLEALSIACIVRWSSETQFTVASLTPLAFDEHRSCFRIPTYKWGILEQQEVRKTCTVINISTGGVGIITSKAIPVGDSVTILVKMFDDAPVLRLTGEVVRCAERSGGKFEHGVKFANLSAEMSEKLVSVIFELQSQGMTVAKSL